MSSLLPNKFISKKENKELEEEDKIISKYIFELKEESTRNEAMEKLYSFQTKHNEKIALYLWYSGGTMAVLLQELIKLYIYLPPFNSKILTKEVHDNAIHILFLLQCLVKNPKTKTELIESGILVYVLPFLSNKANDKYSYMIKVATLSLFYTLLINFDMETFNFLKQNEIIPIILKFIIHGKTLDKNIATHIILTIISRKVGLDYFCEIKERLKAIILACGKILMNNETKKLKKMAWKIILSLTENNEAKDVMKTDLLESFKNFNLDESLKSKIKKLEKILLDQDMGLGTSSDDSKIQKLKNDLTSNSNTNTTNVNNNKNKKNEGNNNILHNLNLTSSNSFNGFNNGTQKQMGINSSEYNNNKLNINMMFMNNMNQLKMPNGYMMPQVGDCNLNKDNEGYMNLNMFNQNGNAGYGNMNYYNSFKNI